MNSKRKVFKHMFTLNVFWIYKKPLSTNLEVPSYSK